MFSAIIDFVVVEDVHFGSALFPVFSFTDLDHQLLGERDGQKKNPTLCLC